MCFSKEDQAGFDAWILAKAIDGDSLTKFFPTIPVYQVGENHFKCFAVQGVVGLRFHKITIIGPSLFDNRIVSLRAVQKVLF